MPMTDQERLAQIADAVIEIRTVVPLIREDIKDLQLDLRSQFDKTGKLETSLKLVEDRQASARAILYPTFIATLGLVVKAAWGLLTGK